MKIRLFEHKRVAKPKIFLKAQVDIETATGEHKSFVFSGSQGDVVDLVIKAQDIHRVFYKKLNRFGGRKRVTAKQMYGVMCDATSVVHYQIAAFLIDGQLVVKDQEVVDFLKKENERLRDELERSRS